MIETAQAFGVDIGGSGIKAAPVNLEKGEFAEPRLKILTPEVSTPKAVGEIVRQQLEHFEVPESAPVGIAFPAPIHVGEKLGYMANLDQSWVGVDVTEVFSEACGRPVTVVNDADAAGLAEQQFGAAKGQDGLVVATTLGTGIGSGIILGGKILRGFNFAAGEMGHNVIVKDGIQCTCGRRGCWERYASASALTRETKAAMQADKNTIMWKMTQDIDHVNAKLAFDAAAKGDETARKVIDSWIEYVGVGIANVINTFEPEVICIGGGVSNQGEVLLAPVRAYAENETRNITTGKFPVICACQLHNDAGVIGAAALGSSI